MNVEEFAELVEKANKANDESVCVFFTYGSWKLWKGGNPQDDLGDATLMQALTENGVIS